MIIKGTSGFMSNTICKQGLLAGKGVTVTRQGLILPEGNKKEKQT